MDKVTNQKLNKLSLIAEEMLNRKGVEIIEKQFNLEGLSYTDKVKVFEKIVKKSDIEGWND